MRIFPVFIPNAGCPGGCVFCDQKLNSGVVQAPTPDEVFRLLGQVMPDAGLDQVAFYGGSFTALPERLQDEYLAAVRPYLDKEQVGGIRLSTRPDKLSRECAERLHSFGVKTVELGCQSFSNTVLMASGRACRAEVHAKAVSLLRDAGLSVGIQLMPGLPGATDDEACESLQKALQLKPDFLRIYPTVVLSGTRLATAWRDGRYLPLSLDRAIEVCADMALMSHAAGVPVLRFGLQASAELDSGAVLAGPYHPAFGERVQSCLWLRALLSLTLDVQSHAIKVNPRDLSAALGQRRSNVQRLKKHRPGLRIEVSDAVPRGLIRIKNNIFEMMALAAGNG